MAWSIRTPPAARIAARSVAMNGSNPVASSPCGENAVSPQSCPRVLNRSGGAPTLKPSNSSCGRDHAWLPPGFIPTATSEISPMRMPCLRASSCTAAKLRAASHCRNMWNWTSRDSAAAKLAEDGALAHATRPASRASSISLPAGQASADAAPRTARARAGVRCLPGRTRGNRMRDHRLGVARSPQSHPTGAAAAHIAGGCLWPVDQGAGSSWRGLSRASFATRFGPNTIAGSA